MTLLLLALLALGASPLLLWMRFGSKWALRPFGLLAIAASIYHGLSEIVIRLTGADELMPSRPGGEYTGLGALIGGVGLLAMTLGYLVTSPRPAVAEERADLDQLARQFDWRLWAVLTVPLLAVTASGEGYASGRALATQGVNEGGLAVQFLVPVVILTGFGLLLRHRRAFVPIVAGQGVALGLAGQRLEIILSAVVLGVLAHRVGIRPQRRQIAVAAVVAVIGLMAISSVRAESGRRVFQSDSGAEARLAALWRGVTSPSYESVHGGGPVEDAALRLDSNNWTGNVARSFDETHRQPVGTESLTGVVRGAIPSVLFPDKLVRLSVYDRSPKVAAIAFLGIPDVDYLTGHVTTFYAALGFRWLLLFNGAVGLVLGLLDRSALRNTSAPRLLLLLLLAQSALFFERGIDFYLLSARAFLVLGVVLWAWSLVFGNLRLRRPERANVR